MLNNKNVKILVLGAGKGKRMQSDLPKVLVPLHGKAMIQHVRESIADAHTETPIAIVGHQAELVKSAMGDSFTYAFQDQQLGTGHAVSCARGECTDAEHVVVLSGDQPFISSATIQNLINEHLASGAKITFTSTVVPDFEDWRSAFLAFGRILRENGAVVGIREYKDATDEQKEIKEVNAGCYIFDAKWLWTNLENIKNENAQGEYYLTDLFSIAFANGEKIGNIQIDPKEALGANSKEDLEILEKLTA